MRFFFIVILFFSLFSANCQVNAGQIIKSLPNGAVLVRLTSKAKTIDAIKEKQPQLSQKIADEQKQRNQEIIDAFNKGFTICPVYYFYDYHSMEVRSQNFSGILLDNNMKPLAEYVKLKDNYLIAEFGETLGDSIHLLGEKITKDEQGRMVNKTDTTWVYYQGQNLKAVVLFTPDLIAVQRPLPRYVRKNVFLMSRTPLQMIQLLDQKLRRYMN